MNLFYADDSCELHHGDCRTLPLADGSVQTCVTSPPYFGLRDYSTGRWEGGDPACEHGIRRWEGQKQTQVAQSGHASQADRLARTECVCGAVRVDEQIGLESTPDLYVAAMVGVFREVRRAMKDDGTLWLNLGDSYAGSGRGGNPDDSPHKMQRHNQGSLTVVGRDTRTQTFGLKPKDLIGIPWRVAFALQADGWYLRSDIIWHKPNPMPESVTDRPTRAHEYIFLLSKSAKYLYDHEAIKVEGSGLSGGAAFGKVNKDGPGSRRISAEENARIRGTDKQRGHSRRHAGFNDRWDAMERADQVGAKVNRRDVWTVCPANFPGAHFATFPPDLIEPCILAGSKPGDTVLDPFNGSGTTGEVCRKWGRRYVGVDLNAAYLELSKDRFRQGVLFAPVPA